MLSIHTHIHAAAQKPKEKKAGRHQHIGEDLHRHLWDVVKIVTFVQVHQFNHSVFGSLCKSAELLFRAWCFSEEPAMLLTYTYMNMESFFLKFKLSAITEKTLTKSWNDSLQDMYMLSMCVFMICTREQTHNQKHEEGVKANHRKLCHAGDVQIWQS